MQHSMTKIIAIIFMLMTAFVGTACSNRDGLSVLQVPSANFNERIQHIVIHYTAENNARSLQLLTTGKVSSHYLIMQGNQPIYQLVADDKVAWHAGQSFWRGRTHLNDSAIGIEIVNAGIHQQANTPFVPFDNFVDFEEGQILQVGQLLQDLSARYAIDPRNIVAHSDVSLGRKIDPGAKFPWERLYREFGVGAWYDDADKAHFLTNSPDVITAQDVRQALHDFGYHIEFVQPESEWDKHLMTAIYAFQLHFNPQHATGVMDKDSYAILQALNYKYSHKP